MARVSRHASELSLFCGVAAHEEERAPLLRALLQHNRELLQVALPQAERFVDAELAVQLVEVAFRRVTSNAAGRLDHDVRLESIALRGESDVAVPVPPRRELRCELGGDSIVLTVATGGRITLALRRELRSEQKVDLDEAFRAPALFEDLVAPGPVPRPPVETRALGALRGELPDRLVDCVADLMDTQLRLHVLCSASGPDPKPVVLDRLKIDQYRPDTNVLKWRTFLQADFHPSSLTCACFVNGKEARAGKVRFNLSFCGRCTEDDTCPTHSQRDCREQAVCLAQAVASVFCVHSDGSHGAKLLIPLNDRPVQPALLAVATAAVLIAEDPEQEDAACAIAEGAVEEAEMGLAEARPQLNELHDKRALHALRTRMAYRKSNGRLTARAPETPGELSELSASYGHLFPTN